MSVLSFKQGRATKLHRRGEKLYAAGDEKGALRSYKKAIQLDPERPETLYNIGLIYKYRRQWQRSLDFNARAYRLDPQDEPTRWNLAIAATALRDWAAARRAWRDNGLEIEGEGPIELDFGATPIRLNPEGAAEVVWGRRVDPVRARIESVPLPESGFRCQDVVLHDGAAVGYRVVGEAKFPVFNVLELFEASDYSTYRAVVEAPDGDSTADLEQAAADAGIFFEDWTESLRTICAQCSEGTPHEDHDRDLEHVWVPERRLGLASTTGEAVRRLLAECQRQSWCQVVEQALVLEA